MIANLNSELEMVEMKYHHISDERNKLHQIELMRAEQKIESLGSQLANSNFEKVFL